MLETSSGSPRWHTPLEQAVLETPADRVLRSAPLQSKTIVGVVYLQACMSLSEFWGCCTTLAAESDTARFTRQLEEVKAAVD